MSVDVECPNCGKVVQRSPSQVRWRGARFCSYACRSQAGTARRMATCKNCGKRYERAPQHVGRSDAGKYCSRECYRSAVAADRSRRVELVCPSCGETFSIPKAWLRQSVKNHHCSRACAAAGRVRTGSEVSRGRGWRALAERIRVRDGRRCVRCSEPEAPGRRLPVDHIVPWVMVKQRPEVANEEGNLATLCDACHGRKTTLIEPRLLAGEWLALQEFYGREVMLAARARYASIAA